MLTVARYILKISTNLSALCAVILARMWGRVDPAAKTAAIG